MAEWNEKNKELLKKYALVAVEKGFSKRSSIIVSALIFSKQAEEKNISIEDMVDIAINFSTKYNNEEKVIEELVKILE